jgi:hypothetical protein
MLLENNIIHPTALSLLTLSLNLSPTYARELHRCTNSNSNTSSDSRFHESESHRTGLGIDLD